MARLTSKQYDSAKAMWKSGDFRLKDISKKFEVTEAALHRRFKRDNVKKGADQELHQKALNQAVENTAAARATELAQVATEIKDQVLRGTKMLNQRMLYEVAKATKEGKPLGNHLSDFKALNEVAKGLQTNYRTASEILGLDKEDKTGDDLPELTVKIMDEEDVKAIRQQQEDELEMLVGGDQKTITDESIAGDTESLVTEEIDIVEEV